MAIDGSTSCTTKFFLPMTARSKDGARCGRARSSRKCAARKSSCWQSWKTPPPLRAWRAASRSRWTTRFAAYKAILAEGVERLKAMGFSPTARLGMGAPAQQIAGVAEEIGANLVVVGHRPTGPLARWWFGSVEQLSHRSPSLQCPDRPNRNRRRSVCPIDRDTRGTGIVLRGTRSPVSWRSKS